MANHVSPGRRASIGLVLGLVLGLLPASVAAQAGDGNGLEQAIRIQERITPALMTTPGVVGTGVAVNAAGRATIRVYTVNAQVAGIPSRADGVAIERVVTGLVVARACQDTGDPKERCNRPVPIGVSVGHPDVTAGTIGARVRSSSGSVFALSNNHVLANSNEASAGDSALQPGAADGGTAPADTIGTLADWQVISFNYTGCTGGAADPNCNTIDAAIASTTTSNLGTSTLSGYGTPSSTLATASVGQSVTKCGRTTGCTTSTVAEINVTIDVCYKPRGLFFCRSDGIARFVEQTAISGDSFSAGGDSGSLIVTSSGNEPVGLLFAGGSSRTYANEIDRVLGRFNVTIDSDTTAPPDATPPAAPTGLTATAGDGQVALDWANNSEGDLAGYNVYRSTTSGGPYDLLTANPVTTSAYTDSGLTNGQTYHYVVTALDASGNESAQSAEASATPTAPPAADAPSNLTATVNARGNVKVDLAWTGGGPSIDVFRRSPGATTFSLIATVSNGGSYRDMLGRTPASGDYSYRVCNASTTACSNDVSVAVP